MHPHNDGKPKPDQKIDTHADKGEKHEAAATDDDTSKGADRAADKDNEGSKEDRALSDGEDED